jgi:heptosyltransferase-2
MAFIARCSVFLTNDTGLMHVATAMQVPVVAIFGATVPAFGFTPFGENHIIVEKPLKCRPCGIHGKKTCKEETFACMKEIHPEEVYEAVVKYI